jgi:hypothetical protein
MKKSITAYIYLFLLPCLVQCTGTYNISVPTDIPIKTSQASSTDLFYSTEVPTKPVQPFPTISNNNRATSTFSPNPNANADSINVFTKNCFNVLPTLPLPNEYRGKLLLNKSPMYDDYFYDLQTAQLTKFPDQGQSPLNIVVTPDRLKYAYHDQDSSYLKIYYSDGRLQRSVAWENDWRWLDGWLDGSRIIFETPIIPNVSYGISLLEYPEPLLLLNLANNQRQKLLPEYPGIDQASNNTSWWSGTTLYDSSLTRVVYPGIMEKIERNKTERIGMGYILWDIPDKKELAEVPALDYIVEPKWSPDWSRFIVNADGDFYIVTRDGVVSQITNFNPNYGKTNGISYFDSQDYSWSPDGVNVALWLNSSEPNNSTLVVLNTQTRKITDYCIQPRYDSASNYYFPKPPIWSPDGKVLAIEASTGSSHSEDDTVMIDFEKGIASKIASGLVPIGWLAVP